jgi:hypothetical protein
MTRHGGRQRRTRHVYFDKISPFKGGVYFFDLPVRKIYSQWLAEQYTDEMVLDDDHGVEHLICGFDYGNANMEFANSAHLRGSKRKNESMRRKKLFIDYIFFRIC